MSTINGAGTRLSISDEDHDSHEDDDPDEPADELTETSLPSCSGAPTSDRASDWENHVYVHQKVQARIDLEERHPQGYAARLTGRGRRFGHWLLSKWTKDHRGDARYDPIPLAEAGSHDLSDASHAAAPATPEARTSFRLSILRTGRQILTYSWSNVLLVFVPIGYITYLMDVNAPVVFTSNALAVIPLSNLLTLATECIACDMGDSVGAMLNISFGNLIEMIIFSALANDHIRIVQAALLGSILINLLLILGTAVLVGSLKYKELGHNPASAQTLACLLALSVFSMLIPSAFHYSFRNPESANQAVLKLSRASSVLLLLSYILYLLFHLKSHAYLSMSMPTPTSISDPNHGFASVRHSSPDSPGPSVPQQMKFMNRNSRAFHSTYDPDNAIELQEIDKRKESVRHNTTGPDQEIIGHLTIRYFDQEPGKHLNHLPSASEGAIRKPSPQSSLPQHTSAPLLDPPPFRPTLTRCSSSTTALSRPASLTLLLTASSLVSVSAFFLTNTIDAMVADTPLSEAFIGLIILPVAGNAAEHITAMTVAAKNKMDLAIGVSVGSSIQIALCVTPAVVLLGWGMGKDMSLHFSLFETVTLVAAAGVVVVVILNGRTNYLEGWLLCACYVIVGFGAYLYPTPTEQM